MIPFSGTVVSNLHDSMSVPFFYDFQKFTINMPVCQTAGMLHYNAGSQAQLGNPVSKLRLRVPGPQAELADCVPKQSMGTSLALRRSAKVEL
jgi:hypothetical protein